MSNRRKAREVQFGTPIEVVGSAHRVARRQPLRPAPTRLGATGRKLEAPDAAGIAARAKARPSKRTTPRGDQ